MAALPSGVLDCCDFSEVIIWNLPITGWPKLLSCWLNGRVVAHLVEEQARRTAAAIPTRGRSRARGGRNLETAAAGDVVGDPRATHAVGGGRARRAVPAAGRRLRRALRPLRFRHYRQ